MKFKTRQSKLISLLLVLALMLAIPADVFAGTAPTLANGVQASVTAEITAGESYSIDLGTVFTDEDNSELTYTVAIDSASPVTAEKNYSKQFDTAGSHTLVFTASDSDGSVTYTVNLTVNASSGNRSPVVKDNAPTEYVAYTQNPRYFDLSEIFTDPDGDELSYSASTNGTSYSALSDSIYTGKWYSATTATLYFKATDPSGESAVHTVTVTVNNRTAKVAKCNTPLDTTTVNCRKGDTITPLIVDFESPDGGTVSYQWYVRDISKVGIYGDYTEIPASNGGKSNSITPSSNEVGIFQYYVVIRNSLNEEEGNYVESFTSYKQIYVTENTHIINLAPYNLTLKVYDGNTEITLSDIGSAANSYHYYGADLVSGKTYKYEAFDADAKSVGGGSFTANEGVSVYTLRQAKFTVGTLTADQYTLSVKDGLGNATTLAKITDGEIEKYSTIIPVLKDDANKVLNATYECTLSDSVVESGYVLGTASTGTVSFAHAESQNVNSVSLTVIQVTSITVPKDAKLFVGYKKAHYVAFPEVAPYTTKTSVDGKSVTYYYGLSAKSVYNLRVTMDGKITYADKLTATADGTQHFVITEDDLIDKGVTFEDTYDARIYLNINKENHLQLENVGDTYRILGFRIYQIIDTITNNYFVEPDFHYEVISGKDVVSVDENGVVTALKEGEAIITVTYDALQAYTMGNSGIENANATKHVFRELDADQIGVVVVTVGENGEVETNIDFDADFETVYYATTINGKETNYNTAEFTFIPQDGVTKVSVMHFKVNENKNTVDYSDGFVTKDVKKNDDGSYTVTLTRGRNILKVETADGVSYQVLRADGGISIKYENLTTGEDTFAPGDKVGVTVIGSESPVLKMSGIYNPQSSNIVYYNADGDALQNTTNAFQFTIPASETKDTYILSNGEVYEWWFGSGSGAHRDIDPEKGAGVNMNAGSPYGYYSLLPEISIPLTQPETRHTLTFVAPDGVDIKLQDNAGNVMNETSDNCYALPYGTYTYTISGSGYETTTNSILFENTEDIKIGVQLTLAKEKGEAWDGTTSEPELVDGIYQITNAKELAWFAAKVNEGSTDINGVLKNDIYLSTEHDWTPIGNNSKAFVGTFDGAGYTVYDMTINGFQYKGLFGRIAAGGVVKDVTVTGSITNESATYNAQAYHGGIAGLNAGDIIGCTSEVNITGFVTGMMGQGAATASVGGVAGRNTGTITDCIYKGNIEFVGQYVGGIAGLNAKNISGCINEGNISGKQYTGGITGGGQLSIANMSIVNCANTGNVSATGTYTGGIIGYANMKTLTEIKCCYNSGEISGTSYVGGIVGSAARKTEITDCYNAGAVSGTSTTYTAGIAGYMTLAGSSVTNCYNYGKVGGKAICAFVKVETITAENCYYLNGMEDAFTTGTTAKSEAQLKALAETLGENFAEDNFVINSGYPILTWQPHGTITAPDFITDLDTALVEYTVDETANMLKVKADDEDVTFKWFVKKPGSESFEEIPYEVSNFYIPDTSMEMYGTSYYYVQITKTIGKGAASVNSAQTPIKVSLSAYEESALNAFEEAVDEYTDVIENDGDVVGLFRLEMLYNDLSDNAKKAIDESILKKYNGLFDMACEFNHKFEDYELIGAPWYIRLTVVEMSEDEISNAMKEAIGENVLINIADVNIGIYTPDGYYSFSDEDAANLIADEAPFTFTVKCNKLSSYGKIKVLHEKADGTIEEVKDVKATKDTVSITNDDFSPYAIVGTKTPKTGDSMMIIMASMLFVIALTLFVIFKRKANKMHK